MDIEPKRYRAYGRADIDRVPQLQRLSADDRTVLKAVSAVLPFKANAYLFDELIDWSDVPNDPIYQLTVPQPGMLETADLDRMCDLVRREAPKVELDAAANEIRGRLNPHPAGQQTLNVPQLDGRPLPGMQHKYRDTVLFFPSQGQTCHAYCTYCFRWAQFVGIDELKFAARETESLVAYLRRHPEVTSVLFTGGDPMIMRPETLRSYIEPLLKVETVQSIRIGTKVLGYWPYALLTDKGADEYLRLFGDVVASGRNLAFMAHYSHPRELETAAAEAAVRRVRATGAVIRAQAPLIRHVNDDADTWAHLWREQVRQGVVPYYMFVERDTGPKRYFEIPLARAFDIFRGAITQVSGLARTARGPSMSALPGKVQVDGITEIEGRRCFALSFLQARNPDWVRRPFYAEYDETATWLDDLVPAFGADEFFFERELREMQHAPRPVALNEPTTPVLPQHRHHRGRPAPFAGGGPQRPRTRPESDRRRSR